jgi:creatinine amidohydrolase
MDCMIHLGKCKDIFPSFDALNDIFVGAYKIMNRIEDVPLVTGFGAMKPQSCAPFNDLFALGFQSAAVGYCFGENSDHAPTSDIPDIATRDRMAEGGEKIINAMVERMDMPHVVDQLRKLEAYGMENEQKYPWMPSAWNRR